MKHYFEKTKESKNWYIKAIIWHFNWFITGHKPQNGIIQQILEHLCIKYRKYAGGSYWFKKLSDIEYTIRTYRAWWLPKWYTKCYGNKPHDWKSIEMFNKLRCTRCGAEQADLLL